MPVVALGPGSSMPLAYGVSYRVINESSTDPGSYNVSFSDPPLMSVVPVPAGGTKDLKLTSPPDPPSPPAKATLINAGNVELGVVTPGL